MRFSNNMCGGPVCFSYRPESASHLSGQPIQHLLGFFPAPDFVSTAILFALSIKIAERIYKSFELIKVHLIDRVVGGDIVESVAMGLASIQIPDFVNILSK